MATTDAIMERRNAWAEQATREPMLCQGHYAIADPSIGIRCCYTGVGIKVYAATTNQDFIAPLGEFSRYRSGDGDYVAGIYPQEEDAREYFALGGANWRRLIRMNDKGATVAAMNAAMLDMEMVENPASQTPEPDDLPF